MTNPEPQKRKPRKPTLKQQRFIDALPTAKSQTEAAVIAGYPKNAAKVRASENVSKSNLKPLIEAKQAEISKLSDWNASKLAQEFATNAELGRKLKQTSASNQAYENIGKIIGAYEKDNQQRAITLPPIILDEPQVEQGQIVKIA
jgi:phage terminase small subunit